MLQLGPVWLLGEIYFPAPGSRVIPSGRRRVPRAVCQHYRHGAYGALPTTEASQYFTVRSERSLVLRHRPPCRAPFAGEPSWRVPRAPGAFHRSSCPFCPSLCANTTNVSRTLSVCKRSLPIRSIEEYKSDNLKKKKSLNNMANNKRN